MHVEPPYDPCNRYLPGTHASVGEDVGCAVGYAEGTTVGTAVGYVVGAAVGTDTHTVAPNSPFVHRPTMHASQRSYTPASWYLPDGQCSQLVFATAVATAPDAQALHEPPVLVWNFPTGQSMHDDDSADANRPFAHAVHETAL